ncbi:MAG TPA: PP2C family protein-serine/threonine phosphatase, partial [Terriglobia bacterium]|nr:PP2C family protein-serine/threonine phosphatase [Terriglobia bacterium]
PPTASTTSIPRGRPADERTDRLRRDRDGLERELHEAAQVQRRFGAFRHLRRGAFDIAGEIFPVRHVSGDLLTVFDAGRHTLLGLGDIAGKGLGPGMWFTHLAGLIRLFAGLTQDPAKVMAMINRHLIGLEPEPPITTLFLARADTRTGELTYSNAGHPAPLVLRVDGSAEWLDAGGPVLGALDGAEFVSARITLDSGDILFGYSDGILECRNPQGEEFGMERLMDAARAALSPSAGGMLFSLLGATQDFAAGEPRADDFALMVVRRFAPA